MAPMTPLECIIRKRNGETVHPDELRALIDGYTRFQAFYKVVLPQAATGIASTAIFIPSAETE